MLLAKVDPIGVWIVSRVRAGKVLRLFGACGAGRDLYRIREHHVSSI